MSCSLPALQLHDITGLEPKLVILNRCNTIHFILMLFPYIVKRHHTSLTGVVATVSDIWRAFVENPCLLRINAAKGIDQQQVLSRHRCIENIVPCNLVSLSSQLQFLDSVQKNGCSPAIVIALDPP